MSAASKFQYILMKQFIFTALLALLLLSHNSFAAFDQAPGIDLPGITAV